ncbi:hypothetical protein [Yimella lutea]|uniref:hypothetical protein n=1 Tax=Yimella lutea TaxID=587872 RepID=UPI0011518D0F|nr:hypothetical protein [Yimella lutea]
MDVDAVAGLVDVLADAVLSAVELGENPPLDVPAEVVTGDVEAAVPAERSPLQPVASTPASSTATTRARRARR